MSNNQPAQPHQSFWTTLPGIITAISGFIVAITGLVTVLGDRKGEATPEPTLTTAPTAIVETQSTEETATQAPADTPTATAGDIQPTVSPPPPPPPPPGR
jgi:hypothetical protein